MYNILKLSNSVYRVYCTVYSTYTISQQMHYFDNLLMPSSAPPCFDVHTSSSGSLPYVSCLVTLKMCMVLWYVPKDFTYDNVISVTARRFNQLYFKVSLTTTTECEDLWHIIQI
jgi:hypothetical protein